MKPTPKAALIGSRIRTTRRDRRLSMRQLADLSRVSLRALHNYEFGRVEIPRPTLVAIAQSLAVTPEELDPHYLG